MHEKKGATDGSNRVAVAEQEKKILAFWRENKIFEKSERRGPGLWNKVAHALHLRKRFIFYDGPPFATGLPHLGSLLQSVVKDALLRYKTMRGYTVRRRWGWDCHGLPVEVEVEKEIGLKTKQDIEKHGVRAFNERARSLVLRHAKEWRSVVERIGRWVDMDNGYRTMDASYTESVWSTFHRLYDRGLVSRGRKSLHLCPRCSTTLSNAEVAENYTQLQDTEVYVLFPFADDPNTAFVAWTTTPWTLFGNVALGVHRDLAYVVAEKGGKRYVVHEEALSVLEGATVVEKKKGKDLIGQRYTPPLPYLSFETEKDRVWRVYHASHVSAEAGTGIVHLAPAYGEEDMNLAQEVGLPVRHHVTIDGVFIDELGTFAGLRPKEAGNPKTVDAKILAELQERSVLLKSGTIEHSYPVCWRCDTPLLKYATDSWFVHAEKLRDRMVAKNKKVRWVPGHLRDGRFGKWLANAREWSVSRTRFWGAPLPVWVVEKTGKPLVISSLEEMVQRMRPKNTYLFVRHAESKHNRMGLFHCKASEGDGLTDRGKLQAKQTAEQLREKKPTVIIHSPLTRTRQTAAYIAKATGATCIEDPLLRELSVPSANNKPIRDLIWEMRRVWSKGTIDEPIADGESYRDIYRRLLQFLEKTDAAYEGETIVVVTHRIIIRIATTINPLLSKKAGRKLLHTALPVAYAGVFAVPYKGVHWDEDGNIDVHRPYIDDIVLYDDEGNPAYHTREVFDCWFESGSMPYGSHHYPFKNRGMFEPEISRGFPADFICEGLDQTRGWFYSLMAIAVGAFDKAPYKQVITTGLVRAADGRKMSKRLKNYTDPMELMDRYGADSLRHYLLASPVVRGHDIDFQEEQVHDVYKKVYARLANCFAFYESYAHLPHKRVVTTALDWYIRSRLAQVHQEVTTGFESYRLDLAVAPLALLVDDLSTWYLRRSRDRLRQDTEDGAQARETLRFVLTEIAKYLAPIAPFFAEHLFIHLKKYHSLSGALPESVHLCSWTRSLPVREEVLQLMDTVRMVVSHAHEQRSRAGIPVRQPLQSVTINEAVTAEAEHLIADEVNVKEVIVDAASDTMVVLDTAITDELRAEGFVRGYIRKVQTVRKAMQCSLTEVLDCLYLYTSSEEKEQHCKTFEDHIKKEVRVATVVYETKKRDDAHEWVIDGDVVSVLLTRQPSRLSIRTARGATPHDTR